MKSAMNDESGKEESDKDGALEVDGMLVVGGCGSEGEEEQKAQ